MSLRADYCDLWSEQLALADLLMDRRDVMLEPQDLPGRYGRVVRAIDHVLSAINSGSVVGGGWAVWRHGYINRVTHDIDIVLPVDRLEDFLQAASISGFDMLPQAPGRWPKLVHQDTQIDVDVLPEGERPGIPPNLAPTTIPPPVRLGAIGVTLRYMHLPALCELKIAAGRAKDTADLVELIQANRSELAIIRHHLVGVHRQYVEKFDQLVEQADKEGTR